MPQSVPSAEPQMEMSMTFLFDDSCDPEGENQRPTSLVAQIDFRARTGFADGSFRQ